VYCFEEVDNGPNLPALVLGENPEFRIETDPDLHVPAILVQGYRLQNRANELYTTQMPEAIPAELKAIPYYIWDNRDLGEMLVWIRATP
jgi:DUF1680 family protein